MTDERLLELETACRAAADADGAVRLRPDAVLELVNELRQLRKGVDSPSAHVGAVANLHRLRIGFCTHRGRSPGLGVRFSNRIAVQDPGR